MKNYSIILASGSPRRKEILLQVNMDIVCIKSEKEEIYTSKKPVKIVEELSYLKASDVFEKVQEMEAINKDKRKDKQFGENFIVIGADTLVAYKKDVLGKPKSEVEAIQMLQKLQGTHHFVYTGVTLIQSENGIFKRNTFHEVTKVFMYKMNQKEIESYVNTKEPMDKAGAYAIQGIGAKYVKRIEGDYFNVMGLPIAKICKIMQLNS